MTEQTSEQSNIVEFPELKFPPIEYGVTTAALAELTERYKDPDASTDDGYEHCKDGCRELTALRTAVETRRKDLKAPALNWGRDVDKQAKDIVRRIKAIEDPVRAEKERIDEIKQAEARKAAEAEQQRIDDIRENIAKIESMAPRSGQPFRTASDYQAHIAWLTELEITDEVFGEFIDEAEKARELALLKVTQWRDTAIEQEKADRKREAEQAEIDRQKKELDEREAKQRQEQDQLDREKRDRKAAEEAEREEAQKKAEREEADRKAAEERRITDIKYVIETRRTLPIRSQGSSSVFLEGLIAAQKSDEPTEAFFAEFLPDAQAAWRQSINTLEVMLKNEREHEAKQRRDEEARLPDKDKLIRWCDAIASIPEPEVLNDKAQKIIRRYGADLSKLTDRLRSDIGKL